MLVACLFAISINAAEIPEWTNITEVDGMSDKSVFGDDGKSGATSRVLMSDGVTYPAYYITKNSTTFGISFSDLNSKTGKSYTSSSVVRIEMPKGILTTSDTLKVSNSYSSLLTVTIPDGATTISSYAFKGTDKIASPIVKIDIPSTVNSIGQEAFAYCNSLEEIIIPEGVTAIPVKMAAYTSSLKNVVIPSTIKTIGELAFRTSSVLCDIVIPEGCTKIDGYAFKGTNVTSVTLPSTIEELGTDIFMDCPMLTSVYSKSPIIGNQMFYNCDELSVIVLENTVEIGDSAFLNPSNGVCKVSSLVLPDTLTTIGNNAFARISITSLVLPKSLVNIGNEAFKGSANLQKVVVLNSSLGTSMFNSCSALKEIVFTDSFESFGENALASVSQTSFITYYTGTDYDRLKSVCSNSTRLSQAKYYSYEDYQDENYTYNKYMVIYGANLCEVAFDGEHDYQGTGYCVDGFECSMCPKVIDGTDGHDIVKTIEYANGFTKAGAICEICENDGCKYIVSSDAPAIFECLGYSVNSDNTGIATGFAVNQNSLLVYENLTGKRLTFGVVIFNPKYLGNDALFTQDGKINASKGALQVEFDLEYPIYNLSVSGMSLENLAHASLELVFAGYAYTGDDSDSIQILQKEYVGTAENPISSPMSSKVTRGSDVLYTIKLQTVITPAQISFGKEGLNEF